MNDTCPKCGGSTLVVPAGTSTRTGNAYKSFSVCSKQRAEQCEDSGFSSDKQWAFKHGDFVDDGPAVKVISGGPQPGDPVTGVVAAKPAKAAPKSKAKSAPKAPSEAVRKVVFANKIIEALREHTPAVRDDYLDIAGYNESKESSYVMFINKMDLSTLTGLADEMEIVE